MTIPKISREWRRERQTDRQTDKQTDRDRDRDRDRPLKSTLRPYWCKYSTENSNANQIYFLTTISNSEVSICWYFPEFKFRTSYSKISAIAKRFENSKFNWNETVLVFMRRHFFNYCIRQLLKDMRLKKLFPEIVKYSKEINCDGILSI